MSFEHLLSFEFYGNKSQNVPSALGWTLKDGTYKAVMVSPDDHWLHIEDLSGLSESFQTLREQGEDLLDIARELMEDISDETLFCDDIELGEEVLTALFDAVNLDMPFELRPLTELFEGWDLDQIQMSRAAVMDELGLAAGDYEENLLVWRALMARHHESSED